MQEVIALAPDEPNVAMPFAILTDLYTKISSVEERWRVMDETPFR
jgi:hypothetical protein